MRKIMYVGIVVLVVAAAVAYSEQPPRGVGRYVVTRAGDSFSNFVWVLDTVTGEVTAHRLVGGSDGQGEPRAWSIEYDIPDSETSQIFEHASKGEKDLVAMLVRSQYDRERRYRCRQYGPVRRLLAGCR